MAFVAVQVHSLEGRFLGFSIQQEGSKKLHNANIWPEAEADDLRKQLSRLNDQTAVLAYWPDVRDPDVLTLTNDPTWEPLALTPVDVIDEDKSIYVWLVPPSEEDPFGRMDPEKSVIVHKTEMAPAPTDVQKRIKLACETVARRRAAEASVEA